MTLLAPKSTGRPVISPRPGFNWCPRFEECLTESDDAARGWIALPTEDVHGLDPTSVAIFCPECARVEFGYRAENRRLGGLAAGEGSTIGGGCSPIPHPPLASLTSRLRKGSQPGVWSDSSRSSASSEP